MRKSKHTMVVGLHPRSMLSSAQRLMRRLHAVCGWRLLLSLIFIFPAAFTFAADPVYDLPAHTSGVYMGLQNCSDFLAAMDITVNRRHLPALMTPIELAAYREVQNIAYLSRGSLFDNPGFVAPRDETHPLRRATTLERRANELMWWCLRSIPRLWRAAGFGKRGYHPKNLKAVPAARAGYKGGILEGADEDHDEGSPIAAIRHDEVGMPSANAWQTRFRSQLLPEQSPLTDKVASEAAALVAGLEQTAGVGMVVPQEAALGKPDFPGAIHAAWNEASLDTDGAKVRADFLQRTKSGGTVRGLLAGPSPAPAPLPGEWESFSNSKAPAAADENTVTPAPRSAAAAHSILSSYASVQTLEDPSGYAAAPGLAQGRLGPFQAVLTGHDHVAMLQTVPNVVAAALDAELPLFPENVSELLTGNSRESRVWRKLVAIVERKLEIRWAAIPDLVPQRAVSGPIAQGMRYLTELTGRARRLVQADPSAKKSLSSDFKDALFGTSLPADLVGTGRDAATRRKGWLLEYLQERYFFGPMLEARVLERAAEERGRRRDTNITVSAEESRRRSSLSESGRKTVAAGQSSDFAKDPPEPVMSALRSVPLFMSVPYNDYIISNAVRLTGVFVENELRWMMALTAPGDVMVDVGAHCGTYAVPMAKYLKVRSEETEFRIGVAGTKAAWQAGTAKRHRDEVTRKRGEAVRRATGSSGKVSSSTGQRSSRRGRGRNGGSTPSRGESLVGPTEHQAPSERHDCARKRRRPSLSGAVVAFEPFRLYFQKLNANAAINGLENIFAYNHAIGGAEEDFQLLEHVPGPDMRAMNWDDMSVPPASEENGAEEEEGDEEHGGETDEDEDGEDDDRLHEFQMREVEGMHFIERSVLLRSLDSVFCASPEEGEVQSACRAGGSVRGRKPNKRRREPAKTNRGEQPPREKTYVIPVRGADLIKVDVEGRQDGVFFGGLRMLQQFEPVIMFEDTHGANYTHRVPAPLRALGYDCVSYPATANADYICVVMQRPGSGNRNVRTRRRRSEQEESPHCVEGQSRIKRRVPIATRSEVVQS